MVIPQIDSNRGFDFLILSPGETLHDLLISGLEVDQAWGDTATKTNKPERRSQRPDVTLGSWLA